MTMRIPELGRLQLPLTRLASTGIGAAGGAAVAPQFALPAQAAQIARMAVAPSVAGLRSFATTDTQAQRRRSIGQGRDVMDGLDQLKLALLAGEPVLPRLNRLARALEGMTPGDDPQLDDILDAIRLRAEVELAKADTTR